MELFPFQKTTNFIQNQLALMKIPGLKHIKNQAPVHKNKDWRASMEPSMDY